MKHDKDIAPENQADHETGLEIIRVLKLRRRRDNGRIETTQGDKTPCCLARTLRHLPGNTETKTPMNTTITGTAAVPCLMGCGQSIGLGLDQVPLDDLEAVITDRATAARWYNGCVCPSCTPAAAAADEADDWVSDGRP